MNKIDNSLTRRTFLRTSAAASLASPFLLSFRPPGQKNVLRHACIGVGGMGAYDLQNFKSHPKVKIVAICDVDEERLNKAAEILPDAKKYTDWRELLKEQKDQIDSVNVSIPDHSHFSAAYSAIIAGKHVYCQKPLCHDVAEIRVLTEAAKKAGVKTQLGTQIAATVGDQIGVQLLKDKAIGKIKNAYLCSNRPGAVKDYRLVGPRPETGQEPPKTLHWDLWIGTAPVRPYAPEIYHPAKWRAWEDFGTGWSGDIGCHIFDPVWKGLGLSAPKSVIAKVQDSWKNSPARRQDTWPQGDHITWIFPGNDFTESDELPLEWFDGEFYPPEDVRALYSIEKFPAESSILIGTEGALLIPHQERPVLLPQEKFKSYKYPEFQDGNHYHHFVDACLGGPDTKSHFSQTGPMTEAIILGTVAIRFPDTLLEWDAANLKIPNHPEAEKLLSRKYRQGWGVASF